ncbi:hypothetical protein L1887_34745 [Cichorium endivia]|nr:hypothetical protein L1887_34745 [Cichorium endivia]
MKTKREEVENTFDFVSSIISGPGLPVTTQVVQIRILEFNAIWKTVGQHLKELLIKSLRTLKQSRSISLEKAYLMSFQLHHVFTMDDDNGAEEKPTLIDRKDNVFIISNFKSKYPVLQLDLRFLKKWIPIIKEQWLTFVTNMEPHARKLSDNTVEFYHESKKNSRAHITNIKTILDPYIKEVKKFTKPYINRLSKTLKAYVNKAHVFIKPYKPYSKKFFRGYRRFSKGTLKYHRQVHHV